jgi:natural product biosynthesis luciferase-like monooxygenase protein
MMADRGRDDRSAVGTVVAGQDVRQALAGLSPEKRALLALKLRRQGGEAAAGREGWLSGERREVCLAYWRGRLAGAPRFDLPADRPPDLVAVGVAPRQARRSLGLPRGLVNAVARLGRAEGVGAFEVLLAAWATLLARWTGNPDLLIGAPVSGNPVALRVRAGGDPSFREILGRVRQEAAAAREHADLPAEQLAAELGGAAAGALFQVAFVLEEPGAPAPRPSWPGRPPELLLGVVAGDGRLHAYLDYQADRLADAGAMRALYHFRELLAAVTAAPERSLSRTGYLTEAERHQLLHEWNDTGRETGAPLHERFAAAARRAPETVALAMDGESRTYGALARQAAGLAAELRRRGFGPGALAVIELEHPFDRVAAVLAALQAGGAWLAAPEPPPGTGPVFHLDEDLARTAGEPDDPAAAIPPGVADPDLVACVAEARLGLERAALPLSHRALAGRLAAFDRLTAPAPEGGTPPLADLAVDAVEGALAWFSPLARGARIELLPARENASGGGGREIEFSLFFFAGDASGASPRKYRLLLESARFADREGFAAVWTPERHFHSFGGLYPNPAVSSAALAAATRRIELRAGSLVLPLHDPVQAAHEWATVDVLSGGRVGIAFASGWHADDFTLRPQSYAARKDAMDRGIEQMRALWRGEPVEVAGEGGEPVAWTLEPRPVRSELPFWITSSGNVDTFVKAGQLGAGVLTNLLGQGLETVAEKLAAYRAALAAAGHGAGSAVLMLHAFLGDSVDEVREIVRDPFCRYLRGFSDLFTQLARSMDYKVQGRLSEADVDFLMGFAFQRYFDTAALCGTPESALDMVGRARAAGVDEIACLIDFGVDEDAVLASLHHLAELRRLSRRRGGRPAQPRDPGRRPLGRPLAGGALHLLSAAGEPVPVGIAGEVHLGGDGLALGYSGHPDRTAERFVPDPFSAFPGGRLFRTGDRAVRRGDGSVEPLPRRPARVAEPAHGGAR